MSEAVPKNIELTDLEPYLSGVCKIYIGCPGWKAGNPTDRDLSKRYDILVGRANTMTLRTISEIIPKSKVLVPKKVLDIELAWVARMKFKTRRDGSFEAIGVERTLRHSYKITVSIPSKCEWVNGERIQLLTDFGDIVVLSLAQEDIQSSDRVYESLTCEPSA